MSTIQSGSGNETGKEGGGGVKKGEWGEGKAGRGGKKNKTEKGLC